MKSDIDTLLISANFFGYSKEIKACLERNGRSVWWAEDRPATDNLSKALLRTAPFLLRARAERYFFEIAKQASQHKIRDVLVIKGEAMSQRSIRHMREAMPSARFTLYFWDSYRNMPKDSPEKVGLFDRALTFDPIDAATDSRLQYRPLFYLDEFAKLPAVSQDIDILFVGTVHTDRYKVLRSLSRAIPRELRFIRILYVPSQAIYWGRRLLDPVYWSAKREEFTFTPVGKATLMELMARARIVVDIERAIQSGYTMRTIEALGATKKLITTNPSVNSADFYDPSNILVIDRRNPVIPGSFLMSQYVERPETLRRRYSLQGWLDDVLSR